MKRMMMIALIVALVLPLGSCTSIPAGRLISFASGIVIPSNPIASWKNASLIKARSMEKIVLCNFNKSQASTLGEIAVPVDAAKANTSTACNSVSLFTNSVNHFSYDIRHQARL